MKGLPTKFTKTRRLIRSAAILRLLSKLICFNHCCKIWLKPFTRSLEVKVTARYWKAPSFDFACSGSEHLGLQGYDLGTRLDSTLTFTAQTASLSGADDIRITGQNFGFDLAAGVTEVALDPEQDHYYLEISPVSREN